MGEATERYAVVTGANKGIGLEIVMQLASAGIKVVLTARNEKKGLQALETIKASGLSHLVVFHHLDVADAASVASLADFIKSEFGKLDILVNNAAVLGAIINDVDIFIAVVKGEAISEDAGRKGITQTYELAEECLQTNYYGPKITVESLLPLLQLSDSPRIVNVSSFMGQLESFPKGSLLREVFSDADNLSEEKVDEILKKFLKDFQEEGSLESKGWPSYTGAYIVSKAAINAYTRILAKKYPSFCINSVCPGYVKTDINANTGFLTAGEGAASPVRLALLPNGSPSGLFYSQSGVASF